LIATFTVTYAWLVFEETNKTIQVPKAKVELNVKSVEPNNTKQLVPTKYYWLETQTDEYLFYIEATNLLTTLTDQEKKDFYQELLDTYNVGLVGAPVQLRLEEPLATPDGIYIVVYLDGNEFSNFGQYRSWRNANTPVTFSFSFTLK
jgi:hypothetical protein